MTPSPLPHQMANVLSSYYKEKEVRSGKVGRTSTIRKVRAYWSCNRHVHHPDRS